jgi:hypothetical protein
VGMTQTTDDRTSTIYHAPMTDKEIIRDTQRGSRFLASV